MSLLALQSAVTRTPEDTQCPEWRAILASYQGAVEVYSRAVAELSRVSPAGFGEAWLSAEKARQNCDNLRTELLDHELHHGCFAATSADGAPHPATRGL